MSRQSFTCFLVRKLGKERIETSIEHRPLVELPDGDVLVRVEFSSLNYKDALAASGHPGVARHFPHVPGIDAAGTVVESRTNEVAVGERVILNGFEFGAGRWGGWAEYARVPSECVVPLPSGLSTEQAMRYGTAGFTAALSVRTLEERRVTPDSGEVVVTGATGGVGCLAVMLLAKLGYTCVAVTGKSEKHGWLQSLGARRIIGRQEVDDKSDTPLLKSQWAGGVDTVGGNPLTTILRSTKIGGCVTACGLVAGTHLSLTVFPFILRGITLAGIDSAWCPRDRRLEIWEKLAGEWRLDRLDEIATTVELDRLDDGVQEMLNGKSSGRLVIRLPNV